jgi:hypothetical protein
MTLFTTALGLYGGVLWSGELQGFILHDMMPTGVWGSGVMDHRISRISYMHNVYGRLLLIIFTASGLCFQSDGLGPPADLVPDPNPDRLCHCVGELQLQCALCLGCILTPSLSPSAAEEYFHLVAPGPVLGRTPKKGHLKKRMIGLGA